MDFLNTREWAIAIWLIVLVALSLLNSATRKAAGLVVKAALAPKLVSSFLVLASYIAGCLWLLSTVDLWGWGELKTTLWWAAFSAPSTAFRMATNAAPPKLVRGWISDTISAMLIIELVALTYTFPIWLELLLVPVLFFLVTLATYAGTDRKYQRVKVLLDSVLALIGIALVFRGVWMIIANWSSFATLATLRDFYIAPLLSFALIPFLYAFFLYARYEEAFAPLRVFIKDDRLRDNAQALAMIAFNVRTPLLQRWRRRVAMVQPTTREQIKDTIKAVLRTELREKRPPPVSENEGWCPIAAGKFLAKEGLATGDYHEQFGEWFASSPMKELNSRLLAHNLAFYIEGDETAARQLRLKLNINGIEDREAAMLIFQNTAKVLLSRALPVQHVEQAQTLIAQGEPFSRELGSTSVAIKREDFPNKKLAGFEFVLELRRERTTTGDASIGPPLST